MIEKWWSNSRPILCQSSILPVSPRKASGQKEKSAAPAKWLVQRFAFCTLGVLALSIYALTRRFSQGQGDRGSRKSYSHTLLHNPAPAALWGVPAHFRIVEEGCRAKCSWRPIPGLPPCVTAFRLVCRSFCFADKVLLALYHTPPPIKNQEVWARFVDTHKFIGFFRVFLTEKAHA